jgi:hypothetical protein
MGQHLTLSKDELKKFIHRLLLHAFSLKLTWITIDNSTKKLVGILLHIWMTAVF